MGRTWPCKKILCAELLSEESSIVEVAKAYSEWVSGRIPLRRKVSDLDFLAIEP